jgi:DNA-binding response OmpR family regulator
MARILVVEDDPAIALGLEDDLTLEGYEIEIVKDGEAGVTRARDGAFDLVLLDIMLPKKDGFEVCRELRRGGSKIPIIMLTAKTHDAEKVLGLEVGADDYVTKPFSPAELRARIKAVLRRTVNDTPDGAVRAAPRWQCRARHPDGAQALVSIRAEPPPGAEPAGDHG